jgi:hypothetical protein
MRNYVAGEKIEIGDAVVMKKGKVFKQKPDVRCNKADECFKMVGYTCLHSVAHYKTDSHTRKCCTKWSSCFEFPLGQDTAVRCIKI